jgi:hypothetical protein
MADDTMSLGDLKMSVNNVTQALYSAILAKHDGDETRHKALVLISMELLLALNERVGAASAVIGGTGGKEGAP